MTEDDDSLMKNLIEQGLAFTVDEGFDNTYQFTTKDSIGEPNLACAAQKASEEACLCCMQKHTHWWVDEKGARSAAEELVRVNLNMDNS